jgi:L-ascorbate metabolism protein UlaG (beta-lactamase superfamily)
MTLNRETAITYIGHGALLIESPRGRRILIDPWTLTNPYVPAEWQQLGTIGRVDMILVTHLHGDHSADVPAIAAANPDAMVVGIVETVGYLAKQGVQKITPMNMGGTVDFDGIQVTLTQAHHSSSFTEQDGQVVYGGEPAGFVVRLENGFTIYASGDTCVFGDMALIRELYQPDLACLPIGDHYTMGPREASIAIRLLGVRHVIPIHYATFPVLTGRPEALTHDPDVTIHVLQPGQTLR